MCRINGSFNQKKLQLIPSHGDALIHSNVHHYRYELDEMDQQKVPTDFNIQKQFASDDQGNTFDALRKLTYIEKKSFVKVTTQIR